MISLALSLALSSTATGLLSGTGVKLSGARRNITIKNGCIRGTTTYNGNGTFTDGMGTLQPNNAFRSLMGGRLADYQVGLALNMPLGFRAELSAILEYISSESPSGAARSTIARLKHSQQSVQGRTARSTYAASTLINAR